MIIPWIGLGGGWVTLPGLMLKKLEGGFANEGHYIGGRDGD